MFSASRILQDHGGVARGSLLHRFGHSRAQVDRAVRSGTIVRVRNGVFAVPDAHPDIIRAAGHGGALTCAGALRLHGIWVIDEGEDPHVWLGSHGRVHHGECSCVGHFYSGRTGIGLAALEDALVHSYLCRGAETFFAALESALALRKIGAAGRARIRARLPAGARWLVDFARTDAGSGLESLLRLRFHLLGVALDCQVAIPTVGRVDFVVAGFVIVEADGAEHHSGSAARHRDLTRDAAAALLGYETLRFDFAQIVHEWPTVAAAVLAAIARVHARA